MAVRHVQAALAAKKHDAEMDNLRKAVAWLYDAWQSQQAMPDNNMPEDIATIVKECVGE